MTIAIDNIRRITLRVPSQLHQALTQVAAERDVSLNHLAIEALELYLVQGKELALSRSPERSEGEAKGRFPLQELSDLLAPAAQTRGLIEEEMMRHVKEARRRIWYKRYREMVEGSQKAQAT